MYLHYVEFDGLLLQKRNVHVLGVVPPLYVAPHEYIVVLDDAAAVTRENYALDLHHKTNMYPPSHNES